MNKYRIIFFCPCYVCKRSRKHEIFFFSLWPLHRASLPTAVLHLNINLAHDLHPWLFVPIQLGKGHTVQTMSANPQEQPSLFQEPSLTNYSQSLMNPSSLSPTQSYALLLQVGIFHLEFLMPGIFQYRLMFWLIFFPCAYLNTMKATGSNVPYRRLNNAPPSPPKYPSHNPWNLGILLHLLKETLHM